MSVTQFHYFLVIVFFLKDYKKKIWMEDQVCAHNLKYYCEYCWFHNEFTGWTRFFFINIKLRRLNKCFHLTEKEEEKNVQFVIVSETNKLLINFDGMAQPRLEFMWASQINPQLVSLKVAWAKRDRHTQINTYNKKKTQKEG